MKIIWLFLATLLLFSGCSTKQKRPFPSGKKNKVLQKLYLEYEYWEGSSYKYGGTKEGAIDCSAFVQSIYKTAFGKIIPRTTWLQAKEGRYIAKKNLKAGDLVFFKTSKRDRHVGIYLKNGKFMHASSSRGVTISSINSSYWRKKYWMARRILR